MIIKLPETSCSACYLQILPVGGFFLVKIKIWFMVHVLKKNEKNTATRGQVATRGQTWPRVAPKPRVAKLGHAWQRNRFLKPRVAELGHAWPSSATRGFHRPRVAAFFFRVFWPCVVENNRKRTSRKVGHVWLHELGTKLNLAARGCGLKLVASTATRGHKWKWHMV